MGAGAAAVLVVAVVIIAASQLALVIVLAITARRALREVATLRVEMAKTMELLRETTAQVGGLAAEATGTIHQAREAVSHLSALAGMGRSVLEGAVGNLLLRTFAPGRAATGVAQAVLQGGALLWQTLARRRAQRAATGPIPEREPLGTGPVRRLSRAAKPLGPGASQQLQA